MKLIVKQYLASLRERGELDVVVPDLLSELGFNVISKPSIGGRQNGVDVAAVGLDPGDGAKKVFLLSLKAGDLKRANWDVGEQALRPSLTEIKDVYIPTYIPEQFADLPIVICICIGGDIDEKVRANVEGYCRQNTTDKVSYQEWNGDFLAGLLLSGVLRENAFDTTARANFRKAVAMVDEPDISYFHFRKFAGSQTPPADGELSDCLTFVRQLLVATWTVLVWARDAKNLEAPYLCSEWAVLSAWNASSKHLEGEGKKADQLRDTITRLIGLQRSISAQFVEELIIPYCGIVHGLSSHVPSRASLDVNLKLFDWLGRLALYGLTLHQIAATDVEERPADQQAKLVAAADAAKNALAEMINCNPILFTPVKDDQAIDINLACLLLRARGDDASIAKWTQQMAAATALAYKINSPYPCVFRDYRDLISHPKGGEKYRKESTSGSILIPTLAFWLSVADDSERLGAMSEFVSTTYSHSTLQLWYPGEDSEAHIYLGDETHGLASTDIQISNDPSALPQMIAKECEATRHFESLSAVRFGQWPIVALACRHNRCPVPPQLWF